MIKTFQMVRYKHKVFGLVLFMVSDDGTYVELQGRGWTWRGTCEQLLQIWERVEEKWEKYEG